MAKKVQKKLSKADVKRELEYFMNIIHDESLSHEDLKYVLEQKFKEYEQQLDRDYE